MRKPNKYRIKRRRHALNRIKTGISYDVAEIAKLLAFTAIRSDSG